MKKLAIVGLSILSIAALTIVYNQSNFSAAGRMFQPPPEGHVVGKDNGPGLGMHHAGEECGQCHTMGGKAENYLWTTAGTIYSDRAGREVLKGAEIILEDREGNVISLTSNEAGNFWTTTPIASNPYTVVEPSTKLYVLDAQGNLVQPADPDDPRTWLYKTWVRKGYSIRPMVTIGPAASTSGMSMSCNMHHGVTGSSRGALWVSPPGKTPPTSYPSTSLSYRRHINPIVRTNCSPCHIPGNTMTRVVTKTDLDTPSTSIDYSAGLDLTVYGGSTASGVTKKGIGDIVDLDNADNSLLLRKPTSREQHAGGVFWDESAPEYLALRQWILEGAKDN